MDSKKTIARILGSGIYNLDTNVVREYPDGPGSRRFASRSVSRMGTKATAVKD